MANVNNPIGAFAIDDATSKPIGSPIISLAGGGFCPPGTVYNSSTGQCESVDNPLPFCFYPSIYNELTGECDTPDKAGTASPPVVTVQQGPVTVTVNNAVQITDKGIQQVADAVHAGIADAAQQAADIASATANEVINGVGKVVDGIGSSVNGLFGKLGDWLSSIGSWVKDNAVAIFTWIKDNIGQLVKTVADEVKQLITPIVDTVTAIAKQVQQINDTLIQPIATIIQSTIGTISSLTIAIEKDLKDGLSGILQIPTDIATGLTSLDATLNRTVQQLGSGNKEIINTTWKPVIDETIGAHLKSIGDTFVKTSNITGTPTTFSDNVSLPEPGARGVSKEAVAQGWAAISDFVSLFIKGGSATLDSMKQGFDEIPSILGNVVTWPLSLIILGFTVVAELKPFLEFIEEDAAARVGLAKLSPADALQAWVRKFISIDNLTAELAVQGWDAQRIQVMRDLQQFLIAVPDVIDMMFRGIVTEQDARANMAEHAISTADQDVLIKAAYKVFTPQTALIMWRYNLITEQQLQAVLRENHYTDQEIDSVVLTALRPEGILEAIERHKRDFLFSSRLTADATFESVPLDIQDAGKRDGLANDVIADMWRGQFHVPAIDEWINLFYRGIRTRTELEAVFDYYRVPKEWRDDAIQSRHALIPFRTIPSMVSSGIISESYAKQQLTAHGFDQTAVNALLDYSKTKKATTTATTAIGINSLSIGVAKSYWDHGALTDAQYHDVLLAHGYNEQEAALTVQVQSLEHQSSDRKQIGTDIVNEVLSGLITVAQAQQQMAANQFTVAESAKVLSRIARTQRATSKTPGEPQLLKFLKKGIITIEDYADALSTLGYSQKWVDAFVAEQGTA